MFIVIPYSVDMEKEATASQVEYMARRREKIYLIQILHIYTRQVSSVAQEWLFYMQ